ncbi:MAG: rubredoxin [Microcoleaceae cyanobacterium]
MQKYICKACEYIYNPAVVDSDFGIAPRLPFEALPDDDLFPVW